MQLVTIAQELSSRSFRGCYVDIALTFDGISTLRASAVLHAWNSRGTSLSLSLGQLSSRPRLRALCLTSARMRCSPGLASKHLIIVPACSWIRRKVAVDRSVLPYQHLSKDIYRYDLNVSDRSRHLPAPRCCFDNRAMTSAFHR